MRSHPNGGMIGVNNPSTAGGAIGKFDTNDHFSALQEHPVTSPSGAVGALGTSNNWPNRDSDPLRKHVLAHVQPNYITNYATDLSGNNWEDYTSLSNNANGARLSLMGPNTQYWTTMFNNADTLTFADNANHQLGTGPFTIECWFKTTSYSNAATETRYIVSRGVGTTSGWGVGLYYGYQIKFDFGASNVTITPTTAFNKSNWNFLQIVRNNTGANGCEAFINGASIGTFTCATNFNDSTTGFIGTDRGNTLPFNGFLADIRVSKIARAASVPTSPLVNDANTAFLALPIAARTNTILGGAFSARASWQQRSPVTPFTEPYTGSVGSIWMDGNLNTQSMPQVVDGQAGNTSLRFSGDFTAECWFFGCTGNAREVLMSKGTATTGWELFVVPQAGFNGSLGFVDGATVNISTATLDVPYGAWCHIAVVRSGSAANNVSIYLNGNKVYSCTATTAYTGTDIFKMGQTKGTTSSNNFNGGLSQVKLSNIAKYSANFTPITSLVADTGTVYLGLTSAYSPEFDTLLDTGFAHVPYQHNTTRIIGKNTPLDTSSGWSLCNTGANESSYYVTNNTNFDFGTGDFSIEFFHLTRYTWDQTPRNLIDTRNVINSATDTGYAIRLGPNATAEFVVNGSNTILASTTRAVQNVWMHICVQRRNGVLALYFNGVQEASCMFTNALTSTANPKFGSFDVSTQYGMYGFLSNVRINKGDIAYKKTIAGSVVNPETFTVPTSTLTAGPSTVFLSFHAPIVKDYATPAVANVLTQLDKSGNTNVSPVSPFVTNYSSGSPVSALWDNSVYTGSLEYNGNKNYMWMIGGGAFTIDFWLLMPFYNVATPTSFSVLNCASSATCGFEITANSNGTSDVARVLAFKVAGAAAWYQYTTTSASLLWDSWNHVSIVFGGNGGSGLGIYINGVRVGYGTPGMPPQTAIGTAANLSHASCVDGLRISNIARNPATDLTIPIPSGPYVADANTYTLLQRTSTMFDTTGKSLVTREGGTIRLSPGVKKFGTAAIAFKQDRASIVDRMSVRGGTAYWDNYNLSMRFGDFTVECWAAWSGSTAPNANVFLHWYNIKILASATGTWSFAYSTALTVNSTIPVALNGVFQHLALVKRGNIYNLFVDGALALTATVDYTDTTVNRNEDLNATSGNPMCFGGDTAGTLATRWGGYAQDIRITGVARYRPGVVGNTSTMIDIVTGLPGLPTKLLPIK